MVDIRVKKSQQALVSAGLHLLNKNKEASLSEIAKHAEVGRATLYRLFKSKEALVEAVALSCLQTLDEATDPIEKQATSSMHAFELLFELTMPYTEEAKFLASLDYFSEDMPKVNKIIDKQNKELGSLITYAKKQGAIDDTLPTSWILDFIDALFYTGYMQQTEHNSTAKQASELAYRCFYRAVKAQ